MLKGKVVLEIVQKLRKIVTFQEAGLAVGGEDFNPYVMLEVHYNNEKKESGESHYAY